jgi:hypothetical protein
MSLQPCSNNAVTDFHPAFIIVRDPAHGGLRFAEGDRPEGADRGRIRLNPDTAASP